MRGLDLTAEDLRDLASATLVGAAAIIAAWLTAFYVLPLFGVPLSHHPSAIWLCVTFALLVLAFICSTDRPETLKSVPLMFCLMLGAMLTKGLLKVSGGSLTLRQWGAVATGVVLLAIPWYVTRDKPFRLKPHKRRQLW